MYHKYIFYHDKTILCLLQSPPIGAIGPNAARRAAPEKGRGRENAGHSMAVTEATIPVKWICWRGRLATLTPVQSGLSGQSGTSAQRPVGQADRTGPGPVSMRPG